LLEVEGRELEPDPDLLGGVEIEADGPVELVERRRDRGRIVPSRGPELDGYRSSFS
jgi:hypothetical protein